jgi:uncharacterized protein
MSVFTPTDGGARCTVHVTPRAGRTAISVRDGQLLVRLAAAPVEGAANAALIAALSHFLLVPRRAVSIVGGLRSRTKRVQFEGVTPATLDVRLAKIVHD